MLECKDGSLYTGITTDLLRRFEEHKNGTGGHYTRARKVVGMVYSEECANRSVASKREAEIKKMKKSEKEKLLV